jgi:hypothetical protein
LVRKYKKRKGMIGTLSSGFVHAAEMQESNEKPHCIPTFPGEIMRKSQ